jgi:hypothetical protein
MTIGSSYAFGRRPGLRGFGLAATPFGMFRNSATSTPSAFAKRSSISMVGLNASRSIPLMYERSTVATNASSSWDMPLAALIRRRLSAMRVRPSMGSGEQFAHPQTIEYIRHISNGPPFNRSNNLMIGGDLAVEAYLKTSAGAAALLLTLLVPQAYAVEKSVRSVFFEKRISESTMVIG